MRGNLVALLWLTVGSIVFSMTTTHVHTINLLTEAAEVEVGLARDNSDLLPASAHVPNQFASESLTRRVNAYRLSLQMLLQKIPINV